MICDLWCETGKLVTRPGAGVEAWSPVGWHLIIPAPPAPALTQRSAEGIGRWDSGVAGPLRLSAERLRITRFTRGPWWGGLDPQEMYGFLGWVADELDLRAQELAQARVEVERIARRLNEA